jgi:hypothetical protein
VNATGSRNLYAGTWVAGAPQAAQAHALGVRWLVAGGDAGMLLQAARGLAVDVRNVLA